MPALSLNKTDAPAIAASSAMRSAVDQGGPEYRRMDHLKSLLIALGARCGARPLHAIKSCVNYLEVGHWMRAHGFHISHRVTQRRELFHRIANKIGNQRVLYLEFGVASGKSIRYWAQLLSHPAALLHGFDTFEGLPQDWRFGGAVGAYTVNGHTPDISDARVTFFKGLFEETLPAYVLPEHDALVINIDCDLYSSASFVLRFLSPHIRTGTFLYFDEFSDPQNELRAFHDLLTASQLRFSLLAATQSYGQVVFECL